MCTTHYELSNLLISIFKLKTTLALLFYAILDFCLVLL